MEVNEAPQSSSSMSLNNNAELGINSNPTHMEVQEQHVAEMENEIEQLKLALKRVTESSEEEIKKKNKQLAGLNTLKRELNRKVAELSNNLQIEELDLGNKVVHRNIEIVALQERIQVLEELNKGLNESIEELQGHPTQNAHEQRQDGLKLREPELEEPSFDENLHPEMKEPCQNRLTTQEEHVDQSVSLISNILFSSNFNQAHSHFHTSTIDPLLKVENLNNSINVEVKEEESVPSPQIAPVSRQQLRAPPIAPVHAQAPPMSISGVEFFKAIEKLAFNCDYSDFIKEIKTEDAKPQNANLQIPISHVLFDFGGYLSEIDGALETSGQPEGQLVKASLYLSALKLFVLVLGSMEPINRKIK
ncbi:unnamed protein product [Caenorhabditis brenneri]